MWLVLTAAVAGVEVAEVVVAVVLVLCFSETPLVSSLFSFLSECDFFFSDVCTSAACFDGAGAGVLE